MKYKETIIQYIINNDYDNLKILIEQNDIDCFEYIKLEQKYLSILGNKITDTNRISLLKIAIFNSNINIISLLIESDKVIKNYNICCDVIKYYIENCDDCEYLFDNIQFLLKTCLNMSQFYEAWMRTCLESFNDYIKKNKHSKIYDNIGSFNRCKNIIEFIANIGKINIDKFLKKTKHNRNFLYMMEIERLHQELEKQKQEYEQKLVDQLEEIYAPNGIGYEAAKNRFENKN
jgi:hypothetical protein